MTKTVKILVVFFVVLFTIACGFGAGMLIGWAGTAEHYDINFYLGDKIDLDSYLSRSLTSHYTDVMVNVVEGMWNIDGYKATAVGVGTGEMEFVSAGEVIATKSFRIAFHASAMSAATNYATMTQSDLLARTELVLEKNADEKEQVKLSSFDDFYFMPNLTKLAIRGWELSETSLEYANYTTDKYSSSSNVLNLKVFNNLQELDVSHNNLTDIGVLNSVTTLKSLNVSYNQMTNFTTTLSLEKLNFEANDGLVFANNGNYKTVVTGVSGVQFASSTPYLYKLCSSHNELSAFLNESSTTARVADLAQEFEGNGELTLTTGKAVTIVGGNECNLQVKYSNSVASAEVSFQNVNVKSNLPLNLENVTNATVYFGGKCTLASTSTTALGACIRGNNVTIVLDSTSADVELRAADSTSGVGGTAINVNKLSVSAETSGEYALSVYGGAGGAGADGSNGADGFYGSDAVKGGNGNSGGTAVIVSELSVYNCQVSLYGGDGGAGGVGGTGKAGTTGPNGADGAIVGDNGKTGIKGGIGGTGGDGGDGGDSGMALKAKTLLVGAGGALTLYGGNGGAGGKGGNGGVGGTGGNGGNGMGSFWNGDGNGGDGGTGGLGGNGGDGGIGGKATAVAQVSSALEVTSSAQLNVVQGAAGKGGAGGDGGQGGQGGQGGEPSAKGWGKQYNGSGGAGGVGGDGGKGGTGGTVEWALSLETNVVNGGTFSIRTGRRAFASSAGNAGEGGFGGNHGSKKSDGVDRSAEQSKSGNIGSTGAPSPMTTNTYPNSRETYPTDWQADVTY